METRIAFVGSGVMAEVMIRGLLTHGLASPDRIWAAGPRPERAEQLSRDYGVHGTTDTLEAVAEADLIVLSIKPGTLGKVLKQIRGAVRPEQVVMSIVAGARTAAIGQALGRPAIVRCVPSLPCRVGKGLTVWTATPEVSEAARETVRGLLRTMGREVYLADEAQVDRATAAYGTVPALLAQLVKALEDTAVYVGEPRGLAREMILEAILGTAGMMLDAGLSPTELTDQITSPGGITSRALHALNQGRFAAVLNEAVTAAYARTLEIGDQLDEELRGPSETS
ncbi:MAG TPA: pyrroline-5-carboxylate reductase [Thermoanaerobaculia bacterium]|nr:pyrroline-5-carboxylate reductase [Thermoanaerobaculia bacterium]